MLPAQWFLFQLYDDVQLGGNKNVICFATCMAWLQVNKSHGAFKCEISAVIHAVPCSDNSNMPRMLSVLLYFLWSRANNLEDCWMFSEFLHLVLLSSMCIDMVSLICSMLSYWLHFCWNFVVEVVIQNLYSFGMHVYKFLSQSFFSYFDSWLACRVSCIVLWVICPLLGRFKHFVV